MDYLLNIVPLEPLKTMLFLGYLGGALGVFLYSFRPGINPNIPIARFEGKKEFLIIIILSVFWPIVAILTLVRRDYNGDA
jgi:hypothetical protein